MNTIVKSVEVGVPLQTAYDQWTQFEEFPRFMEGVEEVRQVDDRTTHWRTKIAGVTREFDATIDLQRPDHIVAWHATDEERQSGRVTFDPIAADRTRVTLAMEWEPKGVAEKIGSGTGLVERRIEGDLQRFRKYIEERGLPTGAWRGDIGTGGPGGPPPAV